jgi:regulatory protein
MTRKISALKIQKRNKNRVSVYLDGDYVFGLAKIVAAWLKVGQEISKENIEELKAKDNEEVALQKAGKFLSYRPRSADEVRKNLKKHKFEDEIIEKVIDRMAHGGLVNDVNFAELWVENRSEFRPRGSRLLRMELLKKGITDDVIENATKDLNEDELAFRAARKQARKYKKLKWQEFRKKMNGFLARRGFDYGIISNVIPNVWEELDPHNNH